MFAGLLKVLAIPALDLVLDQLGFGCVLRTDHFIHLLAMTNLLPVLALLLFLRNLIGSSYVFADAILKTTGPAIIMMSFQRPKPQGYMLARSFILGGANQ